MSHEVIEVIISRELKELIPGYLKRKSEELHIMRRCLLTRDWETIHQISHKMKGHGGSYGFQHLTILGAKLEEAAALKQITTIQTLLDNLERYLRLLKIRYA